jgi:hypothetical protein
MFISLQFAGAQTVPNGGFENWTLTDFFEEPAQYATSNSLTYMLGETINVTKTTDSQSGAFAARMETKVVGSDTIPGLMMIGQLEDDFIGGGIPFNARPDSLTGYIKYDLAGGDELYIVCLFTRGGLPIGSIESTFTGSQSSYIRISIPVSWFIPFLNPDTLQVILANTSDVTAGNAGSVAYFDNFQFTGTSLLFPNGGFENWAMVTSEEPDEWTTLNYVTNTTGPPYATRTNDSHQGGWAIKIRNTPSFVGETIGFLTNGAFQGYAWAGGMAVDQNPEKVYGYYKYSPSGNDSAQVAVSSYYFDATGDSSILLDYSIISLPAAASYSYFEVPLAYNGFPPADTVNISFSAGLFQTVMNEGSTLWLDDVGMDYYPLVIVDPLHPVVDFSVFPNPASGLITVRPNGAGDVAYLFILYDARGLAVVSGEYRGTARISLQNPASGIYFYRIIEKGRQITGTLSVK